jgi:hypothetical protein
MRTKAGFLHAPCTLATIDGQVGAAMKVTKIKRDLNNTVLTGILVFTKKPVEVTIDSGTWVEVWYAP